ncbi:uncharacterized protein LOC135495116 [Lineus longissimus]|uniref:uncharacterized protein LOC135495116 n=1 Tax=Lineus longissimus TaxID=88925 RepID=UPI002B4EE589
MAATGGKANSHDRKDFKDKIRDFVEHFTANTSFHGVRYTFEAATCFGRTIWVLVVIAFSAWFTYQVVERVAYYKTDPVTVDMNVAYNRSLRFPSVAICNTNQFRMTKAWEAGIYRKLETFYGADLNTRRNIEILDDLNITQTILDMAHRKEDMIKKCVWKGHDCSHHNFTQRMTDFGVCFVFNDLMSVRDPDEFKTQNTGASSGLQLFLNAEVYELSPGPHLPAGIQVLIFNGHDHPRVLDLGTAVPVFEVSRAALHLSSVSRLPDPHGRCASHTLRDFKEYSFQACLAEVITNATAESCGCIGYEQRWVGPDRPPYCNLSTLYGCHSDVNARSFTGTCPHPCHQEDYTTTLSNTGLSTTSISAMLNVFRSDAPLLANYRKALLLRQLVDEDTVEDDKDMLHGLYNTHHKLQVEVQTPLRANMSNIDRELLKALTELESIDDRLANATKSQTENYEYVFRVQTIEKFLNPKLVELEIRTWELTVTVLPYELKPNMFNNDPSAQKTTKLLIRQLQNYFSESKALIYTVEKMYNIYTLKILKENLTEYNGLSVPRGIINYNRDAIIQAIHKFSNFGQVLRDKMELFEDMALRLPTDNKTLFETWYHEMLAAANEINGVSLGQFRSSAQELLKEMKKVSNTLRDGIKKFQESNAKFKHFLFAILDLMSTYDWKKSRYRVDAVERVFTEVVEQAYDLIPIWEKVTKEKLIALVTPLSVFKDAIVDYRRGSNVVMETLTKFEETKLDSKSIRLVHDAITAVQIDLPDISVAFASETAKILPLLLNLEKAFEDVYHLIGGVEKARDGFLAELDDFLYEVESFNKTLRIDDVMIRKNVLALQVFYQSLSLTEVSKSPAYTWFALLCDIGGTAGLFLGASFITILELLYFIGRNIRAPQLIPVAKVKSSQVESSTSVGDIAPIINTSKTGIERKYSDEFSIKAADSN